MLTSEPVNYWLYMYWNIIFVWNASNWLLLCVFGNKVGLCKVFAVMLTDLWAYHSPAQTNLPLNLTYFI